MMASSAAQIAPLEGEGCLRFAPPVTFDDLGMIDGIVRGYPVGQRLFVDGELRGWIPTMPYLAALLASGETELQAAQRYGPPPKEAKPLPVGTAIECGGRHLTTAVTAAVMPEFEATPLFNLPASAKPPIWRILYSLPGLSLMDEADESNRVAHLHTRHYQYLRANMLIDPRCHVQPAGSPHLQACFMPRPDLFAGRVVLLGSSLPSALDRVQTPIGSMSGGELVLNATRAFADFRRIEDPPSLFAEISKKIAGLGLPALVMLLTWGCIHFLRARARTHLANRRENESSALLRRAAVELGSRATVIVIFVAGMLAAAFSETWSLARELAELQRPGEHVYAVDVLLPVVAMGLEGYAEGAKSLADWFERQAAGLVHRAKEVVTGLKRK